MKGQRALRVFASVALILTSFLNLACGTLPRDPAGTSARVQQYHQIRIGLVENPPWVVRTGREPAGVEVALIRKFASSLGARAKWFWGSEETHMEALEKYELDAVLSGLDASTPWSKHVGLTKPYFDEEVTVGVPSGTRVPDELHGLKVAVPEGNAIAAYLRKKGGIAVRAEDIAHMSGPVAAPAWLLHKRGLTRANFILFEKKHVIGLPPENAWLKRLQEYLQEQSQGSEACSRKRHSRERHWRCIQVASG